VDEIETNPIISMCNYPNPFKASATIAFSVAKAGKAKVEIYNIKGQRVKTLLCNAKSTGQNKLVWDGCNDEGKPVSSGMYFYRLEAPGYTKTQKMLYLK
jgi:flagellar hook assembly protein FlgD